MESTSRNMIFIMKPVNGCNLSCNYCYMRSNSNPQIEIMSEKTLERAIKEIAALRLDKVEFNWHGGEPLIAGVDFYKKAHQLQRKYIGTNTKIKNTFQTNGTFVTDEWVAFLSDYDFGVGISIDGPENIHNSNRCLKSGEGSFYAVMNGIKALQNRKFDIHVIPVVTEASVNKAKQLFDFFVQQGINNIAFTPCYPKSDRLSTKAEMKFEDTISPKAFGQFMIDIYDLWMQSNNPEISIRYLKQIIKTMLGGTPNLCIFKKGHLCYQFLTINFNGDVYPCDSYMSEKFLLGNIKKESLKEVISDSKYNEFKKNVVQISEECRCCSVYEICGGNCSYYRYSRAGEFRNRSYYCDSIKMIVNHISRNLFKGGILGIKKPLQENKNAKFGLLPSRRGDYEEN